MDGSWTVRVLKRDGAAEDFDTLKLAAVMHRAMKRDGGSLREAWDLASAIHIYLIRSSIKGISSAAVFEMAVKVLRRVGMKRPAKAMEIHRRRRDAGRGLLRVRHENGKLTLWNKNWLAALVSRIWHISPQAARIIAGDVERHLIRTGMSIIDREHVVELLNARVEEYGLADAVPVRQYVAEDR